MKKINIKKTSLINFNKKKDLNKAEIVRKLIEEVVNDEYFREEILKADFKDRRFIDENRNVIDINNNETILKKIISGQEQYTGEVEDFEWDLRITLYRSWTREIGYRSRENIFTKKSKFRKLNARFIAAHWIHEYMHVIGFTHDHKRTFKRPYSIPYLIGTIASNTLERKEFEFLK